MSFMLVATKNAPPRFLDKNPFLLLYVCELTDHTIYWIKYKADFILYPLSERET